MKNLLIKSLLLIAGLLVSTTASAYDFEVDGIYYDKSGSNATVTYYNRYSGAVVIPKTVTYDGTTYNVTSIGDYAFQNCIDLTSITIPNSVISIGYNAFENCSGLANVYITDLTAWCNIDFEMSRANPLSTKARFYLNKKRVRDLVIPDGVTEIKSLAFYGCSGLTSVTISNSVTSIGGSAFNGCSGLTSVTIPNSVTSIGSSAFNDCSSLTSVTIPNSVTSIGGSAFDGCSSLTSVYITDMIAWCNINFDDLYANPLYYANELYLNNVLVKDLVIPNDVTIIKRCAFSYCRGLTSVTIPNSVTSIGSSAFYNCSGLTSVTIPNGVISIGNSAFYGCSGLTSIIIGEDVERIGENAFSSCRNLATINSLNSIPPLIGYNTFYSVNKNTCVLNVPIDCKIEYQLEDYWKEFININEVNFDLSGVDKINDNNETIIAINDINIAINGCNKNVMIEVYSVNGQLVYRGAATEIPAITGGAYIVKVLNKTFKIAL